MPYIYFTDQQKEQAAGVDLAAFLESQGEKLVRSGRDMRLTSDHSITIRGNRWYDHAAQRGGGPISFVQRFYNLDYPDAVELLLGDGGTIYPAATKQAQEPPKPFVLPPANGDARRVYAYLVKHRGIAPEVVSYFVREGLLYEDAEYHNAVFVGTDEAGVPHHAHKRSTNSFGKTFRINVEGSLPRYSFHHLGTDGTLFVFEAPIDMMSYITLYPERWQEHNYVACCGTSFLPTEKMLDRMHQVDEVFLCLDNDVAGPASQRMAALLAEKGIPTQSDGFTHQPLQVLQRRTPPILQPGPRQRSMPRYWQRPSSTRTGATVDRTLSSTMRRRACSPRWSFFWRNFCRLPTRTLWTSGTSFRCSSWCRTCWSLHRWGTRATFRCSCGCCPRNIKLIPPKQT